MYFLRSTPKPTPRHLATSSRFRPRWTSETRLAVGPIQREAIRITEALQRCRRGRVFDPILCPDPGPLYGVLARAAVG
eukprot:6485165-Lingulodinium_polyedra.AAC.1